EEEQHHEDHAGRDQRPEAEIAELLADGTALIVLQDQADPRWVEGLDLLDMGFDAIRHGHRIRVGLAGDEERHRRVAVDPVVAGGVLEGIVDAGHIPDPHDSASIHEERRLQHVPDGVGTLPDRERPEEPALQDSARLRHVLEVADPLRHDEGVEPQSRDPVLVELELEHALAPAVRGYGAHAIELEQFGNDDLVDVGAEGLQGVRATDVSPHEGSTLLMAYTRT